MTVYLFSWPMWQVEFWKQTGSPVTAALDAWHNGFVCIGKRLEKKLPLIGVSEPRPTDSDGCGPFGKETEKKKKNQGKKTGVSDETNGPKFITCLLRLGAVTTVWFGFSAV